MTWATDDENNLIERIWSVSISASHDNFDHVGLSEGFGRALPVLYRELPDEAQAAAKELASRRTNAKVWVRGFTIERGSHDRPEHARETLSATWDPGRIH